MPPCLITFDGAVCLAPRTTVGRKQLRWAGNAWSCRRYRPLRVDCENPMTSWQGGHVDLLEVDFSIESSQLSVFEILPRNKNPVVVAAEPYDPSAPGGGEFCP